MFALIVPGRMVQPIEAVPGAGDKFAVTIPDAPSLNHISVFMTGQVAFPDGYGATVHLDMPGKGWAVIGGLTNQKPSAIFRLRGTFIPSSAAQATTFGATATASTTYTLGISCEPLAAVEAQVAAVGQTTAGAAANPSSSTALVPAQSAAAPPDPVLLAGLVGKNLVNAVSGFAQPLPDGSGSWIPTQAFDRWYREFERKLKTTGVGFLLRTD
ncbi:Opi10p [Rhodotorula paludigena]|uniref:Hikeshi-like domain-containing protein n=1 Tax=Rhodotorula paludigena TaxID=86838 RepID=A0AAV5GMZ8_9BASI|nr:hypothetical protein Rhopal_003746-T1 [Rhodotorula paludigena]